MNKLNIVKKLNILIYTLFAFLCIFEIAKIVYYGTHRPLIKADWNYLAGTIEMFVLFTTFFVFTMIYIKSGKFRKTSFVLLIVCLILCVLKIGQVINNFNQLFFPTEYWQPPFVDKFTSLFELCYLLSFDIIFIGFFVYLLKIKYYKKSS
ncbi:MAG: hypothetical protein IJW73_09925 [Candidatus Gastranaerophilales bacterium]|nr:hypothetical protein [Candidatus Gastranaerophilales bacterium]